MGRQLNWAVVPRELKLLRYSCMQTPKFRWLTSTQGIFHPCLSISTWRAEKAVQALLYIQACYYQQNLHFVDTGCGSWWVGCRKITSLDQNKTHQQISHRLQNNSCKHQYQVELKTNTQGKQRVCKHFPCPEHLAFSYFTSILEKEDTVLSWGAETHGKLCHVLHHKWIWPNWTHTI